MTNITKYYHNKDTLANANMEAAASRRSIEAQVV